MLVSPALWAQPVTVKIGVIAPLTGGLADRGQEMVRTARIYEQILNAQAGKYRYKIMVEDGKGGAGNAAATAAQKLLNLDRVQFFVARASGETIQTALLAEKAEAITFGVVSGDPAIRTLGEYTFRSYVDMGRGVDRLAKRVQQAGIKTIAVLTEDITFAQSVKKMLTQALGSRIVFSDDFPPDTGDFRTLLTKAKTYKPDAFYFNCASPKSMIPLVNQARDLGLKQGIYSYFMPGEKQFRDATGKNAEGIIYLDTPDIKETSASYRAFMRRYLKAYPQGPLVEFFIRTTHDALKAITDGINQVGPDATAVKEFLKTYTFEGALGHVAFDESGDVVDLNFVIKQIKNGEPQALE